MTLTNDNLLLLQRVTFTNDDLDTCKAEMGGIHSLLLSPFLLSIQVQVQHRRRLNESINDLSLLLSLFFLFFVRRPLLASSGEMKLQSITNQHDNHLNTKHEELFSCYYLVHHAEDSAILVLLHSSSSNTA